LKANASRPPITWASVKRKKELGLIPASESVKILPKETAGFANEVEEVKK
jgi:hypothetical protein